MDREKQIFKNKWTYYPDFDSLLGFIEHVFLSTAFFTWADRESYGFNIPVATVDEVIDVISETYKDKDCLQDMISQVEKIRSIKNSDNEDKIEMLKNFSKEFNSKWNRSNKKILYFRIFENPSEIGEYVFSGENEDFFEEVIEEDIGMTRLEFENICNDVYRNKFLKKKFIDILNCKIGCLV